MATLTTYILQCRRLLHDAEANFWSDQELTDYINSGRERLVRDTGCLRTVQNSYTPIGEDGSAAVVFTPGATVSANTYVFSAIFTYKVTVGGVLGTSAPPYPGTQPFPPSTPFASGTATLQYYAPCEIIPYSALPQGNKTLDVLNINIYWGNSRVPLRYLPWTNFNSQLRYWQNYVGRPVCFSTFGQQQIYVGPVPDQSYAVELDTVVMPTALTATTTDVADTILEPYTHPVAFYACYLAKFKEQSYGEAEIFKQEYLKQAQSVLNTVFTRRIPDPYSSAY